MNTEKMEQINIKKLVPYANNSRTHSEEQIKQIQSSIREFGFINPVLIDSNFGIIAGHARVLAAKAEGMKEVPCVFVDHLTEAQKKAYILADNKLALNAGWDEDMLKVEMEELKDMNFNLELTGFDAGEIAELLLGEPDEVTEDDFDIEPPAVPISKLGDVYQLGLHRLMCGDSTSSEDVKKLMDGKKARFVFTDPPWNVDYGADTKHPSWKPRQILNDHMSTEDFGAFLYAAFAAMKEVSERGCMTYIVMSAQEWGNMMNVLTRLDYHWSSTIIWKKDSLVLSRKDYHTQYEPIWYGWLAGDARLCPLEDRKQTDVWEIDRPKKSDDHPTMKPIELVVRAIKNSSLIGDTVLDLFGGSGTTLIAAEQTKRACNMMELDPKYVDVIITRWETLTGKKAVLLSDK